MSTLEQIANELRGIAATVEPREYGGTEAVRLATERLQRFHALFASAQTALVPATVTLAGKPVITVHWGYGNFTPAIRAQGMASRLQKVASDSAIPLDLTLESSPLGINIRCGDVILASVFIGDAAAENTTIDALAQQWSNSCGNLPVWA